jgi:hypothetical protein
LPTKMQNITLEPSILHNQMAPFWDQIHSGAVTVNKIGTAVQNADLLTNTLSQHQFEALQQAHHGLVILYNLFPLSPCFVPLRSYLPERAFLESRREMY